MRVFIICTAVIAAGFAPAAYAQPFTILEVPSVTTLPPEQPGPNHIAFTDHKGDKLADPISGLIRFRDWAQENPVKRHYLGLFPDYDEPVVVPPGGAKPFRKKLHVYAAEARFELPRPVAALDLAHYARLSLLERIDPAITHRPIAPDDAVPNRDGRSPNRHPHRRWCEGAATTVCIQSRYQLEGRLPLGVKLVNKLREGGRKIADYIEFQSELRVVPPAEINPEGVATLTGVYTPVVGALEQNIYHANQVMQFGKLLAVFQQRPLAAEGTIVTAFMVLGVESDLLEKKKEYGDVPVLRNLIPAQVIAGNSSFNTGNSISAGLPKYARNSLRALAEVLARE